MALEKYEPLRDHLARFGTDDRLRLSFREIEELVGPLPPDARHSRQWWSDESSAQGQAWQSAGWRVPMVDLSSQQVLFERQPSSPFRRYLAELHLPLIVIITILAVVVGAIGFALRPGTDKPPVVAAPAITIYVSQQRSAGSSATGPSQVHVDEIMMQENSSTVLLQLNLFATFPAAGTAQWQILTGETSSQPYSCPDPYNYLGTAEPDPVGAAQNGQPAIAGQSVTQAQIGNFVGHISTQTASNVLGLYGESPVTPQANSLTPLAEINLCWKNDLPMAFDGEFASASLPAINLASETSGPTGPLYLTRALYFENYKENPQPITAEYSLQAGTLPTSTDQYGWHWTSGQDGGLLQVTAIDLSVSQHEAYLGFISGVLLGVVGGAVVLVIQELLDPVRIRRRGRKAANG